MAELTQWAFTSRFEGVIPHLYKDSKGYMTCGVGFLVPTETDCLRLPWSPNVEAALADYRQVQSQPKGYVAGHYRAFCKAYLKPDIMRQLFDVKVDGFRRQLRRAGWRLERYPEPVVIALVDIVFNTGITGINAFVNLRAAVDAGDWARAANECHRKPPVSAERNDATRALFVKAANTRA